MYKKDMTLNYPKELSVIVTNRCDLRCKLCRQPQRTTVESLPILAEYTAGHGIDCINTFYPRFVKLDYQIFFPEFTGLKKKLDSRVKNMLRQLYCQSIFCH